MRKTKGCTVPLLAIAASAATAILVANLPARAASVYWDTNDATPGAGATATGTWDAGTTAHWTTDSTGSTTNTTYAAANAGDPSAADVVFSAGNDATSTNVTVVGAVVAHSITVEELLNITSASTTPSLTLGAGGVTINSTALGTTTWASSLPTILAASQSWTNNNDNLFTVSGTITGSAASGTQTLTIAGAGAGGTKITGIIADGTVGGIQAVNINTAAGITTTLSGANTFTGGVTLTSGILRASASGATSSVLGLGTLTLAGGELQLARSTTGSSNFGRNTVVTGDAQITSVENTLNAGVTHTLGALSIGNETLTIASGSGVTTGTAGVTFGTTTLTGDATFNIVNGPLSTTRLNLGSLDGPGSFTKLGQGVLQITASSSTFTGQVYLKTGTLVTSANSPFASSVIHLGNNTGLQSVSFTNSTTGGGARTISADVIVEAGSTGTKTLVNDVSGQNATFTISGSITLNDNLYLATGTSTATTILSGASITGTGSGFNILDNSTTSVSITGTLGAGINNIVHNSAANISLSGANPNFTGTVQVLQGTGSIGNSALGSATLAINNGAVVTFNHVSQSLGGLTDGPDGGGNFYDGTSGSSRVITLTGSGAYNFSGVIGEASHLNLTINKTGPGTQVFAGANLYNGATSVTGGTLLINNATGSGTGATNVVVTGGTLGGNGTISGAVTVNAGGTLQAGDAATGQSLTISSGVNLNDGSTLTFLIGAGQTHSTLALAGASAFAGTDTVSFIDLGAQTGTFSNIITGLSGDPTSHLLLDSKFTGSFSFDSGNLSLTLTAVPEPTSLAGFGLLAGVVLKRRRRTGRTDVG